MERQIKCRKLSLPYALFFHLISNNNKKKQKWRNYFQYVIFSIILDILHSTKSTTSHYQTPIKCINLNPNFTSRKQRLFQYLRKYPINLLLKWIICIILRKLPQQTSLSIWRKPVIVSLCAMKFIGPVFWFKIFLKSETEVLLNTFVRGLNEIAAVWVKL